MADISDVCEVLVDLVAGIVYPNGTGQPPALGCPPTKIFQGWPLPDKLEIDIAACSANINVYPRPEEHNTTRYQRKWSTSAYAAPALTLSVSGAALGSQDMVILSTESGQWLQTEVLAAPVITVGGTVGSPMSPQNLCVVVNGQPYVYGAQVSDTPTSIATALAALIVAGVAGTTSSGPVITLPTSAIVQAVRVGGSGTMFEEVARQERLIQIGIWSPTPAFRDALAKAIDPVLKATDFLTFADGSSGRLRYKSSPMTDGLEKEQIYRRDLMYTVEYATLLVTPATEVVAVEVDISPAGTDVANVPADPGPAYVTVNVTSP